jgi:hypothetical protein
MLLYQPPSIFPYFVLLSSIAFFVIVLAWMRTGKISEVHHFQGKFVSIKESRQLQSNSSNILPFRNINKGETIVEIAFQQKPLKLKTSLPVQEVAFINKQDKVQIESEHNLIFGTVTSILPHTQTEDKSSSIYKVGVSIDNNVNSAHKPVKLQVGQKATATIIHQSRIADILLEPIKQ